MINKANFITTFKVNLSTFYDWFLYRLNAINVQHINEIFNAFDHAPVLQPRSLFDLSNYSLNFSVFLGSKAINF